MTKTQELQTQMNDLIDGLDIAPFIAEEARHFVNQLTYYKIKKITDQSDIFARYLCALDRENTMMMKRAVPIKKTS